MRPSEMRNPKSFELDLMSTEQVLSLINEEDQTVPLLVRQAIPEIAQGVELLVSSFKTGGRIVHVGAGTSARLALVDAAELPPTYGISPERLVNVIAGGREAVFQAAEHAEDRGSEAVRQLTQISLCHSDVVIGLTASGTTPFVFAGLDYARTVGCPTLLIACNPSLIEADVKIIVPTGPEVVTGSTRMKAGMAQRMVLTMLSTAMAVRLGLVYDNLMVALGSQNAKCLERGCRIVCTISGENEEISKEALRAADGDVRVAVLLLRTGDLSKARALLEEAEGSLRKALERI
ncbi:MAG: N-acetylmuramic acid 6-phosphate etherase [Limnochordia bacterium]|nr:N-acetylmuramic acid 6-phosphate etherase [Limnochordia bacterium]